MYTGSLPIVDDPTIGLAEYSNAYFLTQDTIWRKYAHPAKENTTYADIDWFRDAERVDAEDGKPDNRIYIKYKEGVGTDIEHLLAIRYFTTELDRLGEPDWLYTRCNLLERLCRQTNPPGGWLFCRLAGLFFSWDHGYSRKWGSHLELSNNFTAEPWA